MRIAVGFVVFLTASTLQAQQHISSTAAKQLEEVKALASRYATRDSARAAGFALAFRWLPTMGEHWLNEPRMFNGNHFDMLAPPQLMYSRIDGKETLVGA